VMSERDIESILARRMCLGCGACAYLGDGYGVSMADYPSVGRRPDRIDRTPAAGRREMASVCPGIGIESRLDAGGARSMDDAEVLIGPTTGIWEGWAADPSIRYAGSSGGIVTALALYCLERLGMALVVHTGMRADEPWKNETVVSRTKDELLIRSGSRYSPSSPVEALSKIEASDRPCVFIGKPCDAAAVDRLRKIRPALDANLGLVLSFFCAGTPSTEATLRLMESRGVRTADGIESVRYRGRGWPGLFKVVYGGGKEVSLTYDEAWGSLAQRHRQLRCHLCPDGLGELSDVTGGDAWHRREEGTDGISLILARSRRGREIVESAFRDGYLQGEPSSPAKVVRAQELTDRRKVVRARMLGLRLFGLPVPSFKGFELGRAAAQVSLARRAKETLGMARRVLRRGYLRPEPRE
jgi:coenzyme F420 hydrogenase subunit beta